MSKIVRAYGHQGDTQWFELNELPEDLVPCNKQFIAESERSGSLHGLFGDYEMYTKEAVDGFYIKTKGECIINHTLKSNLNGVSMNDAKVLPPKDHRYSVIPAGVILFTGIHTRFDPLKGGFEKTKD